MKRAFSLFISVFVLGISVGAFAKDEGPNFAKPASAVAPKEQAKSSPKSADAKRDDMKKKVQAKKDELNGSEWKVKLSSGGKPEGEDILTFQDGQVKSKMFADKGFPSTNYTITVNEGSDMTTWETMQTEPKGGVLFIRGEWDKDVMRGVISQQLDENKTKDYNFNSDSKEEVPATTEKKEEPKPVTPPAAVSMPPVEMSAPPTEEAAAEVSAFTPGTTDEVKNG